MLLLWLEYINDGYPWENLLLSPATWKQQWWLLCAVAFRKGISQVNTVKLHSLCVQTGLLTPWCTVTVGQKRKVSFWLNFSLFPKTNGPLRSVGSWWSDGGCKCYIYICLLLLHWNPRESPIKMWIWKVKIQFCSKGLWYGQVLHCSGSGSCSGRVF